MVARGFATWKIRHKEDSTHNECDQEFECNRWTNICNSADVEDSPHNGDFGVGVGSGELGGVGVGGVEVGDVRLGDWGWGFPIFPTPPDPHSSTPPQPNPPNPNPLDPTPTYQRC